MIKVLHVISDSNIGGAGRVLTNLLKNYDRARFAFMVALPRNSLLCPLFRDLNVEFYEIDGLAEQSAGLKSVMPLRRLIKNRKPHIVHTHASFSARVAARLCGVKVVYTRHSIFDIPRVSLIRRLINNRTADRVIAVSPAAIPDIENSGIDKRKIRVVVNGVDAVDILSTEEKSRVRANYGLSDEDFVCGIFARLTEVKGHKYILDAAQLLLSVPNVKILIAGGGELESYIKGRITSDKLTNVIFAGFVGNSAPLIASLDVQLNASFGTEATSMALLEGMSAGIPAVVTNFGGNPFVIAQDENGLLVPQKDAQAMADAIVSLMNPDRYAALSAKSRDLFNTKFTSAVMARGHENIYAELKGSF